MEFEIESSETAEEVVEVAEIIANEVRRTIVKRVVFWNIRLTPNIPIFGWSLCVEIVCPYLAASSQTWTTLVNSWQHAVGHCLSKTALFWSVNSAGCVFCWQVRKMGPLPIYRIFSWSLIPRLVIFQAQAKNFSVKMGGVEYKSNGIVELTVVELHGSPQTSGNATALAEGIAIGTCLAALMMSAAYLVRKLRVSLVAGRW